MRTQPGIHPTAHTLRGVAAIICTSLCLLMTTTIAASPQADASSVDAADIPFDELTLADVLVMLDATEYRTRQHATQWLATTRWEEAQVLKLLDRKNLSVEQRERLLGALYDRAVYRPRGALGVSQRWIRNMDDMFGAFEITSFVRGLPAERFLRPRDRITHFDGRKPVSQDDLLRYLQRKWPGDTVDLTVERVQRDEQGNALRDEQGDFIYDTLQIEVPLGSADKLLDERTGRPDILARAQSNARRQVAKLINHYSLPPAKVHFETHVQLDTPPSQSRMAEMADQHTSIALLKRQLDFIDQGRAKYDDILESWDNSLQRLRRQRDAANNETERQFLEMLIERYQKLTKYNRNAHGG